MKSHFEEIIGHDNYQQLLNQLKIKLKEYKKNVLTTYLQEGIPVSKAQIMMLYITFIAHFCYANVPVENAPKWLACICGTIRQNYWIGEQFRKDKALIITKFQAESDKVDNKVFEYKIVLQTLSIIAELILIPEYIEKTLSLNTAVSQDTVYQREAKMTEYKFGQAMKLFYELQMETDLEDQKLPNDNSLIEEIIIEQITLLFSTLCGYYEFELSEISFIFNHIYIHYQGYTGNLDKSIIH